MKTSLYFMSQLGGATFILADHLNTVMPESGPMNMANALIEVIDFRKQVLAKIRVQEKIDGTKKNKVESP
jgi:hypothetical protein